MKTQKRTAVHPVTILLIVGIICQVTLLFSSKVLASSDTIGNILESTLFILGITIEILVVIISLKTKDSGVLFFPFLLAIALTLRMLLQPPDQACLIDGFIGLFELFSLMLLWVKLRKPTNATT